MTGTAELSSEAIGEVASVVSAGVGFVGCHRSPVWVQGTRAVLSFRLDQDESDRRRAVGLSAVSSPDILNFFLGLPAGSPVPLESLTSAERAMLRTVPQGTVLVSAGMVTRRVVPPLEVELAMVPARSWRKGLERAGRFAPFCSRAMVLHAPPRDLDAVRLEAGFYGIGVVVAAGDAEPDVLVAPARFRRNRFTAAGWRFLEEVYLQVR